MNSPKRRILAGAFALTLIAAACGSDEDTSSETAAPAATEAESETTEAVTEGTEAASRGGATELAGGSVFVTGSSTVEPISIRVGELAGELSGGDLAVTVEGPGTGDGFAKFCAGEADVTDASRAIKDEEAADLRRCRHRVHRAARSPSTVCRSITNPAQRRRSSASTFADLYALLGPEAEGIANWADNNDLATEVGADLGRNTPFPDAAHRSPDPVRRAARTTRSSSSRSPTSPKSAGPRTPTCVPTTPSSANDNVIVEGIESADTSLGWVGFAFVEAEARHGQGARRSTPVTVASSPTAETIADGSYPFARTAVHLRQRRRTLDENPAVASYVDFYLSDEGTRKSVSDAGQVLRPARAEPASRRQGVWEAR